jgi:mono/diheme cytochrome c family protein
MRFLLIPVLAVIPVLALSDGMPASADAAVGKAVYAQTCIACHGANGQGTIPGVTDFTGKDSPLSKSEAELVKNISEGFQSKGSFMAMPAKGGNPALTEADVRAVLAYLRAEFGT